MTNRTVTNHIGQAVRGATATASTTSATASTTSETGGGQVVRMTRQRESVLDQLRATGGFQSAQQIHTALTASGVNIGLATVYRSLSMLSATHAIDELRTGDGETLYRHCGTKKHHHHLVCRVCGTAKEISGLGLESFLGSLERDHGFTDLEHIIEIWGLCSDCA